MAEAEAWVMIPKLDEKKIGCVLDMRPLVLCKDCLHKGQTIHQEDGTNIIVCWNQGYGIHHPIDWFCADGEEEDAEM